MAKYLGVAPWELAERPEWWDAVEMCLDAENAVARAQAKRRSKA